jgi:hypothetical protein
MITCPNITGENIIKYVKYLFASILFIFQFGEISLAQICIFFELMLDFDSESESLMNNKSSKGDDNKVNSSDLTSLIVSVTDGKIKDPNWQM